MYDSPHPGRSLFDRGEEVIELRSIRSKSSAREPSDPPLLRDRLKLFRLAAAVIWTVLILCSLLAARKIRAEDRRGITVVPAPRSG